METKKTTQKKNKIHGFINFPINDPKYKDSGEGGLMVYGIFTDMWKMKTACCGEVNSVVIGEVIDEWFDKQGYQNAKKDEDNILHYTEKEIKEGIISVTRVAKPEFGNYGGSETHFVKLPPGITTEIIFGIRNDALRRMFCSGVYAVGLIYLGSTNASLWCKKLGHYYIAKRKDLNPGGVLLVAALEKLYNQKIKFITAIDT
jgi:hypothetical protein